MNHQSSDDLPKYFVYKKVNGVVFPQIWYYDQINSANGKYHNGEVNPDGPLVFFHVLSEQEKGMSLNELETLYPYFDAIVGTLSGAGTVTTTTKGI